MNIPFKKILCCAFLLSTLSACLKEPVDDGPGPGAGKKPVTQNVQPTAHPACDERQMLVRSPIGM